MNPKLKPGSPEVADLFNMVHGATEGKVTERDVRRKLKSLSPRTEVRQNTGGTWVSRSCPPDN